MGVKIRRVLLTIGVVIFLIFLVIFLYKIRLILIPFFLAAFMAYMLLPFVEAITKKKVPISLAIFIVYFSVAGGLTFIVLYILPGVFSELNRFVDTVPEYTNTVQKWMINIQHRYSKFYLPESVRQIIDETIVAVENKLVETIRDLVSRMVNLFSYFLSIIIIPILTYYFLKDHEIITKKLTACLPPAWRGDCVALWVMIDSLLRKFIRGHLSVALIVGTLTTIALSLLGINYALTLGFVAGAADIIPYFGPIIGAIPAVCLALMQSKKLALYAALAMFLIQQLESSIISPKIIGDSVGLHPLVIIFVLLLGGYLFGILGMLLAVPFTAAARIIINFFYQRMISHLNS